MVAGATSLATGGDGSTATDSCGLLGASVVAGVGSWTGWIAATTSSGTSLALRSESGSWSGVSIDMFGAVISVSSC